MAQNQLQDHQVVAQTPTTMRRSAVDRFGCGAVSGGKDSLKKKKKKISDPTITVVQRGQQKLEDTRNSL